MIKSAPQPQPVRSSRLSTGLGHAYATLGLRAREARVDAIRSAAQKAAQTINQVSGMDRDQLLAEIALCTYRLLDPRNRVRQLERIQLCILSERAADLQAQSRRPLLATSAFKGKSFGFRTGTMLQSA
jgi:hypothetical protein